MSVEFFERAGGRRIRRARSAWLASYDMAALLDELGLRRPQFADAPATVAHRATGEIVPAGNWPGV